MRTHRVSALILCVSVLVVLFASSCKKTVPLTAADFISLGERYLLALDYEQAVVQFQKLIEIDPMNPRGYTGLAGAFTRLGKIGDAISVLRQGFGVLPDNNEFLTQAAEIYEEIIETAPYEPDAYLGLADVYAALGDTESVINTLSRGFERLTDHSGFLARSSEIYEEVIEMAPFNPYAYLGLFDVYEAIGDTMHAVETVIRGHERIKNNLKLNELYDRLVASSGDQVMTTSPVPPPSTPPPLLPSVTPGTPPPTESGSPVTPSPSPTVTVSPTPVSPSPTTSSPAPATTSPAPATLSPTPATSSPAPTTTSPSPETSPPTPPTPERKAPTLTIVGSNPVILNIGSGTPYTEQGATAYDEVDGNISANVRITGSVDISNAGTYTITYTVSNSAGLSATATREVRVIEPLMQPTFGVTSSFYQVEEGSYLYIMLNLTGTQPMTVTSQARNERGVAVSGFSVEYGAGTDVYIYVEPWLEAGLYTVTVTAANATGTANVTFRVEIKAKAPAIVAPSFSVGNSWYTVNEGSGSITLDYSISGTEPISYSLQARGAAGGPVSGFSLSSSGGAIRVGREVPAGLYSVTLTATNSAGSASADFNIEIISTAPAAVAPEFIIGNRSCGAGPGDSYVTLDYILTGAEPIRVAFRIIDNATGNPPITGFSFDSSSHQVGFDRRTIAGEYTITLTASNSVGSSTATFYLTIKD